MSEEAPRTFAGASKSQVESWRAEHGEDRIRLSSVPIGASERLQYIVRAPSRTEYNRYLSEVAKADRSFDRMAVADRNLFNACLLAPAAEEVRDAWEKFPALADKMVEPILKMAGTEAEVREETF